MADDADKRDGVVLSLDKAGPPTDTSRAEIVERALALYSQMLSHRGGRPGVSVLRDDDDFVHVKLS
jgi:hypothetical protein